MLKSLIKKTSVAIPAFALTLMGVTALAGGRGEVQSYESTRSARTIERSVPDSTVAISAEPATLEELLASRTQGARWLKSVQKSDGGWGAGAWGTDDPSAPSDVATTSLIVLALTRDAKGTGVHDKSIRRAVRYVTQVVESSPSTGPALAVPDGTQPQYKLGKLVDTHMAAMMLGEITGTLDADTNSRVSKAHEKVLVKVQLAQQADGSFDGNGWAPVLSSSIAASSLDRAVQLGMEVDKDVMERSDAYQKSKVDDDGNFDNKSGAGVDLYTAATTLKGNAEAVRRAPSDSGGGREARQAQEATAARITGDKSGALFSGFGSVGGEEMLSYMMISDTLADEGGDEWDAWEQRVGSYLVGIQNNDGSWAGHHCITSRTFVTAAAMMTLGAGDAAQTRAARVTGDEPSSSHASTDGGFAPDTRTVR